MESYSPAFLTKKIYDSSISFFTLKSLEDVLEVKKRSTLYRIVNRLIKNKVLVKIEKDKYILQNSKLSNFALANFIYQPSYVSLESALNFYGILSQFPYEITSSTPKKTKTKIYYKKVYSFSHIKKDLFWGYEKKEDFLIALPEKALLDQIYLASRGLRNVSFDEYDFSLIDKKKISKYLNKYPKTQQFTNMIRVFRKYIKL